MAPLRSLGNIRSAFDDFYARTGKDAVTPAPSPTGLTATGGTISDYTDSGSTYRAHIFTSSGTFVVSDLGSISSNVEYLVVAGGGGGGSSAGGGGAGGFRTNVSGHCNWIFTSSINFTRIFPLLVVVV